MLKREGTRRTLARGTRRCHHLIRHKSHFRDLVIIDPSQTFRDLTHTDSTGSRVCDSGRGTPSRDEPPPVTGRGILARAEPSMAVASAAMAVAELWLLLRLRLLLSYARAW